MHIMVVNYRTPQLTIDCLASLEPEVRGMPSLRVTVVDNASPDESAAAIAAAIADHGWRWAELVRSPVNGGFAYGNNLAIRPLLKEDSGPELFWLLNPDTRVVPGAAAAIATFMRAHRDVGIAGTALIEENGTLWPFAFRFPTILSEIERGMRLGIVSRLLARATVLRRMTAVATPVDWVPGASMVVRRAVFDAIGLMDDAYFLYFEETDFCLAARRAGWATWYLPDASVIHIAGQSTGLTDSRPAAGRIPSYWFESRRRYFIKNHGRVYAGVADLAWALTHVAWRLRRRIAARPDPDPPALLSDFLRGSSLRIRAQRPTVPAVG